MTTAQTEAAARHPGVKAVENNGRGKLGERQREPGANRLVFAIDGKNRDQCSQTEQYLQDLIGNENVDSPFIYRDEIQYWFCISRSSSH